METNVRNRKSTRSNFKKGTSNQSPVKENAATDTIAQEDYSKMLRDEGDGESISEMPIESASIKAIVPEYNLKLEFDALASTLFILAIGTRFYKLEEPRHIVFDELHYGKYVNMYMKKTFFFDIHPPLGKQLVALAAHFVGYNGTTIKFDRIGSQWPDEVPVFALRFVPALCGSLIVPLAYYLVLELGCKQQTAAIAALLLLFDNALLTQSRFILMEPILLFFLLLGFLFLLKFRKIHTNMSSRSWWSFLASSSFFLTLCTCVKYSGVWSLVLCGCLVARDLWSLIGCRTLSFRHLFLQTSARSCLIFLLPLMTYFGIFYLHLNTLTKAGPHDNIMTSAFQASLEGGLASITAGQPLGIAHGSQVTLRHSHGRACWLHSHANVYPVKYPDNRGSSHQQQVTCYSFKDVNNWWIVKRPDRKGLVVGSPPDVVRHGEMVELVHGISGRSLNSHDVSAPMSPHNQEVSCYIDYNVSMPAQVYWTVDIINRDEVGDEWHTIESLVRLIHVNSSQALKFSGRQLPDWGYNQFEIVTDTNVKQDDTIWNVEEHRYTKNEDDKEREREMVEAEMIPLRQTRLSFVSKFFELQYKMLFPSQEPNTNHMYASEPTDWPVLTRGIAYWVSQHHNGQVHLMGNIVVWYSATAGLLVYFILLVFYLMRRRRKCFDISESEWNKFVTYGEVLFAGFLIHFIPYFFVDRTLFLHHYFPAFVHKVLLTAAVIDHILNLTREYCGVWARAFANLILLGWLLSVIAVFRKFSVLSYGTTPLTSDEVLNLRWKETWDFIIHK